MVERDQRANLDFPDGTLGYVGFRNWLNEYGAGPGKSLRAHTLKGVYWNVHGPTPARCSPQPWRRQKYLHFQPCQGASPTEQCIFNCGLYAKHKPELTWT